MSKGLVVVTGASRGIGAAVARKAAASGHAVLVNDRDDHESGPSWGQRSSAALPGSARP
jgi:NAD(P)-dependent dehydrogenase (short-subunit alcohol dehydrogenase family)